MVLVAASARAHPFDVSKSEWTVEGNTVRGHVEVALRDLRGRKLEELVATRTFVGLGNPPCDRPIIERAWMEGEDGAAVDASVVCPGVNGDLWVRLTWLKEMPQEHRHVAHLTFDKSGLTAMLTKENDSASLGLPAQKPTPSAPAVATKWPWIAAVVLALALAWMRIRARKR